jgi:hemerythrin-like domain-containing protein
MDHRDRRAFLTLAGTAALVACRGAASPSSEHDYDDDDEHDVSATEDLMREHGVIRRVLVVYRECATRLRANQSAAVGEPLQRAAALLRKFGEDYHEKELEDAHVFPALAKTNVAPIVSTLAAQHKRGREITELVLASTKAPIDSRNGETLARTLDAFARMYEEHAAIEDTIVFPAWKKTLSKKQLDQMGDLFEEIEHKTFGKDGFEDAVAQIAEIEKALGIDLAAMTAAS